MFQRTTAIEKLLELNHRVKVIQGGTWGGKTYGIIPILIDRCIHNKGQSYTVVAESIPAIKRGALKDFKEIMQITGRWMQDHFNSTDRKYTFANGSYIEFSSFQNVGDAQAAGKRTGLFINEAPYISWEVANALLIRTSDDVWIDFNPTRRFWAHREFVDSKDCDFLILTYRDNEGLPQSILDELMRRREKAKTSKYWENWCRVYLDGEIGTLEGVIFQEGQNWDIVDSIPEEAQKKGYGLDFGYSNDPSAWISGSNYDGAMYFDELLFRKGLLNSAIASQMNSNGYQANSLLTVADSSEPKSIEEIRQHGINITGAKKGKDSVNFGIGLLQEEKFYVTARSINLINELRNYAWKTDKDGNTLNIPIENFNHGIDAMRYFATEFMNKQTEFAVF